MEVLYTTQITYIHSSILFLIVFGFALVVAFIFSLIEYYSFDVVQLILDYNDMRAEDLRAGTIIYLPF